MMQTPPTLDQMEAIKPKTEKRITAQHVATQLITRRDELAKTIAKMDIDDPDWDITWLEYQKVISRVDLTMKYYL